MFQVSAKIKQKHNRAVTTVMAVAATFNSTNTSHNASNNNKNNNNVCRNAGLHVHFLTLTTIARFIALTHACVHTLGHILIATKTSSSHERNIKRIKEHIRNEFDEIRYTVCL
uniref:Uncharacterized protein n=1 Tax=Glossina palpalis gambiensis TaxID=67801 RepID=A0A1B0C573_9MUSC